MKTLVKLLGVILLILLILMVGGGFYLNRYVNSKQFTTVIESKFHAQTGRQLHIGKPLTVTIYPWLGFKLQDLSISNAANFKPATFAKVKMMSVQVRLLPLLRNHLQLGNSLIDGLTLNLARNAEGQNNWQDLFATKAKTIKTMHTQTATAKTKTMPSTDQLHIAGVTVKNAQITWHDQVKQQTIRLMQVNVSSQNLSPLKPFPVKLRFDLALSKPKLVGHIAMQAQFSHGKFWGDVGLHDLRINTRWWHQAKQFNFNVTGQVGRDLTTPQAPITFKLTSERLDVDQLLSLFQQDELPKSASIAKKSTTPADEQSTRILQLKAMTIPAGVLNLVNLNGHLRIKHFVVKAIALDNLSIPVKLDNGELNLAPMQANLLHGRYQGALHAKAQPDHNLSFRLANQLQQVQIGEVVKFHQNAFAIKKITGLGNLSSHLSGYGMTAYDLLNSLQGKVDLKLSNGTVQGIDVPYQLQNIVNLATRAQVDNIQNTGQTKFLDFTLNSQIKRGITYNQLHLQTPLMRGEGQGKLDLISQALDFNLTGYLLTAKSHSKTLRDVATLPLSVRMTGTLNHHQFQPDLGKIAAHFLKQHKQKLIHEVGKHLDKTIGGFLSDHF